MYVCTCMYIYISYKGTYRKKYCPEILVLISGWNCRKPCRTGSSSVLGMWGCSSPGQKGQTQKGNPNQQNMSWAWTRALHFCKYHLFGITSPPSGICQLLAPSRQNHAWKLFLISIQLQNHYLLALLIPLLILKLTPNPCYKTTKRGVV